MLGLSMFNGTDRNNNDKNKGRRQRTKYMNMSEDKHASCHNYQDRPIEDEGAERYRTKERKNKGCSWLVVGWSISEIKTVNERKDKER